MSSPRKQQIVATADLSLSPCGRGWLREAKTGEGFSPRIETPHPARTSSAPPSPTRGEGRNAPRSRSCQSRRRTDHPLAAPQLPLAQENIKPSPHDDAPPQTPPPSTPPPQHA